MPEKLSKDLLIVELNAMRQLCGLSNRILEQEELQPLLDEILGTAIALQGADFGNIHLYEPRSKTLQISSHCGFDHTVVKYFQSVREDTLACGRALRRHERVIIEDVETDDAFAPDRQIAAAAGFRAVQATPLYGRNGEGLGALSTHFRHPHVFSERDLRLIDLCAQFAAQMIERKRAQESLQMSQRQLIQAEKLSHTGSWTLNLASGSLHWSEEHFRIAGLEPDIKGPDYPAALSIIHTDDRSNVQNALEESIRNRSVFEVDCRIVRPDGSVRHIDSIAEPVFDVAGDATDFVGTIIDTTERRQTEEKLHESEKRFRLLTESIPQHVWSLRPDGSLSYCNQRLLDYLGLRPEEIQPETNRLAVHPEDLPGVREAWRKAWTQGSDYEMEERLRDRDGNYRRFLCRAVAVRDDAGQVYEWFGTHTDVEKLRRAEESLQKSQAELAHVSRVASMGELTASIAHEINQPLTAIVGNANACTRMLDTQPSDLLEVQSALIDIAASGKRASDIIARIRGLLKKSDSRRRRLNINEVIMQVLPLVRGEIDRYRMELGMELQRDIPLIRGDRVELQQVLINLLINGMEAMSLNTHRPRSLTIHSQRVSSGEVMVAVRDCGPGVGHDQKDKIFDPFFTTKPNGMGMGLAISRSIIEAHGGSLWATSSEAGATFQLALPSVP